MSKEIELDEATTDDLLRYQLDGQDRQLKELRSLKSAMLSQPAPVFQVPRAPAGPAPVVNFTPPAPKPTTWHFEITERDHNGRILSFTATPNS